METDSFFCQLLKQLPQTLFELLGLPGERARDYEFDSVEIKKSLRIDGLFRPKKPALPAYFVEVQFQRKEDFYANLFAKVFLYLHQNPSVRDWSAVAIFASRRLEPGYTVPYEDLLNSQRVVRIYLDEYQTPSDPPFGLGILQLVTAPEGDLRSLVKNLVQKARTSESGKLAIELTEELLIRRFDTMSREEIRKMFKLANIRDTAVWKEAREEGLEEGIEKGIEKGMEKGIEKGIEKGKAEGEALTKQELVRKWLAKGKSVPEIAELLDVPLKDARRLVKAVSQ
jgi:predicted transposase/invertase (TIGR01784 family)